MMVSQEFSGVFKNISQRAANCYLKSLSSYAFVMPEGMDPAKRDAMEASQRDLHAFFQAFYTALYDCPELFGLPMGEDDAIAEDEPHEKEKKQEVTRKLKKPKDLIDKGMAFLLTASDHGQIEGQNLILDAQDYTTFIKKSKSGRAFLSGLESAGLTLTDNNDQAYLHNHQYPRMMTALKAFAEQCAHYANPERGRFFFACCDFRVFQKNYQPDPLDLYRVFGPADYARLSELHSFYTQNGYKSECLIHDVSTWLVQYQGNKKIKATPLFQVEYGDRYRHPLRMSIKCASTSRIAPLIGKQPKLLKDDFKSRMFLCRGAECNWCRNQKTLGPTTLELDGSSTTICWYSRPDIRGLNDGTVELMKAYLLLHEALLPVG